MLCHYINANNRLLGKSKICFGNMIVYLSPFRSYNEPNFQWKALRLLSQRSPLFFASQPAPMQFKTVSQYLKGVIEKLSKEFPVPKILLLLLSHILTSLCFNYIYFNYTKDVRGAL